jgi:hypothetical protein
MSMCEKLFEHVGVFRDHATKHVIKLVDNMHDPLIVRQPHRVED